MYVENVFLKKQRLCLNIMFTCYFNFVVHCGLNIQFTSFRDLFPKNIKTTQFLFQFSLSFSFLCARYSLLTILIFQLHCVKIHREDFLLSPKSAEILCHFSETGSEKRTAPKFWGKRVEEASNSFMQAPLHSCNWVIAHTGWMSNYRGGNEFTHDNNQVIMWTFVALQGALD